MRRHYSVTRAMSDAAVSHPGVSTRRELWTTLSDAGVPAGLALLGVVGVASARGGFFPTSWGWAALAFSWVAALVLLLRGDSDVGWIDLGFFGLLALFVGWIWLSASWSQGAANSILEGERALVVLAGVGAALAAVTRRTVPHLLGAVAAAITLVAAYGLATRLFPSDVGRFDPVAAYRLQEPLGYWNTLGILSVLGVLLCFAFAVRARTLAARALAGAALPFLLPTIYFTYSRGAWLALLIGAAAALLLDPRRLQAAAALLVLAPVLALEVLIGSRQEALTHQASALAAAEHDGKRYALVVVAAALVTAALAIMFARLERAIDVPHAVRIAFSGVLAVVVLAAVVGAFGRYGAPQTMARHAWNSFKAPPTPTQQNLNERLFSFSGNGRVTLWKAAWRDHEANPTLGSGAGTYYEWWYRHRSGEFQVLDAHSLYVETLAELGPIGLALLVLALLVPVAAAVLMRANRLVPLAVGAYVAYLVHAGVDWDWEMTGLTLAAGLVGAGLVAAARPLEARPLGPFRRTAMVAAAVAVAALAFVVLVGNLKLGEVCPRRALGERLGALVVVRLAGARHRAAEAGPERRSVGVDARGRTEGSRQLGRVVRPLPRRQGRGGKPRLRRRRASEPVRLRRQGSTACARKRVRLA
jgi:hypothetical protein